MRALLRIGWLFAPIAALLAAFAACGSADPLQLCGEIPSGGCPIGRGGTCEDPTCTGVYDCVEGAWTRTTACPGNGGSGGGDAGNPDAPCTPVNLVIDGGDTTDDCTTDLEAPDCPADAIQMCAESTCDTGCTDFYICVAGEWTPVAHCDDAGHFIVGN